MIRKLIGARIFLKGFEAKYGKIHPSHRTARDNVGHGTHTLSTAGGNFVADANVFGAGNGTAKGGAPRARVAAYKVCWSPLMEGPSCTDSDILSAFEHAISDGVDVLLLPLGSDSGDFFTDHGISIGSFHAVAKGILAVSSAGNEGPNPATVNNVAPWMLTVASSSIDRNFVQNATLGNNQRLQVSSFF